MAYINSQLLFLTTSPRTPSKMIPEIDLLVRHFNGQPWNNETQRHFIEILREEQFFNGKGENDPALSARDRINRAPKSLGFVNLSPAISLTPAGKMLLDSKYQDEIFLRQLLKFQIPSPYHKPTVKATAFCVKPYLEILRLIRTLGSLTFDELQIFGMQLTDWHNFASIVQKINRFRIAKTEHPQNYRTFKINYLLDELKNVYATRIAQGEIKTRESNDLSLNKFLKTQASNTRDYADACFRYLRATGVVNVSNTGKSLSIAGERIKDVDYLLKTVDRNPCFINEEPLYADYLGNPKLPKLLTDNRKALIERLNVEFKTSSFPKNASISDLKNLLHDLSERRKNALIANQVSELKNYQSYDQIQETFHQIERNELYDAPLMLEWNTWRAMTMLNGGRIQANLNFDDFGKPLSTAPGNTPDIVCDYGDYLLAVEVTMATGQKQYDMEGEPVSRHLGKMKKTSGKPCYCLFLAPHINEACIAHFYTLHRLNISYYGGQSTIVPLPLSVFQKMLEDSYQVDYTPTPRHVRNLFEYSNKLVKTCKNEMQWFEAIKQKATNWLSL